LMSNGHKFAFENVLTGRPGRPVILHVFMHLSHVNTSLVVKH
jgi:hypothetical protein